MKDKNFSGFTIMELLVVISIIGIVTAVSIAFLSGSRSANSLEMGSGELASVIKLAQSYALQGRTVEGNTTPCGFGVKFVNYSEYHIFYNKFDDCNAAKNDSGNLRYNSGFSRFMEDYDLPAGVSMMTDPDSAEIYFTVPHAKAFNSLGAPLSALTLTLHSQGTDDKSLIINSTGEISEN